MSRKLPGSAIVSGSITLTQITGSLNDTSNAAYAQANTARDQANNARSDANTTFATINTTFATLNTSAGTQNTNIGLAYDQANSARGQANTAYGQANAAYGQANAAYGAANTRLSASGGTLSGDLIITGNLTVSGNSTTLNTEILTVEDADVVLLSNVTSTPALNAGIIVNRGTSTNTFIRWNEAIDEWGWSDSGTTTYYFEDLRAGLATTNTTFGTVNTSLGTINTSYQAAYAQANTAGTNALNAYGQANTARTTANDAYGAANTASTASNRLITQDLRTIAPNSHTAGRLTFGFTSYTNNGNASTYADYLHFRSYTDSSGGSDNLVMFHKSGIGMRIWQQTWNSANAYSSYVDVLHSSNYSSYAVPLSGGTMTGQLNISAGGLLVTGNSNFDSGTLFVDSVNDRIGIGMTNPNNARLHASGVGTGPDLGTTAVANATAVFGNSDRDYGMYFAVSGNGNGAIQQRRGATAVYYDLLLQPYGGNVGIGTTSPATLLSLGSPSHTSPTETNRILNWYSSTSGTELHNSAHRITIGVDSSSTAQPQLVGMSLFNRNSTNNVWSPALIFGGMSTSGNYMNGSVALAAQLPAHAADTNFRGGDLHIFTQSTTENGLTSKFVLKAGGNVGIGTTTPSSLLDVRGSFGAGSSGTNFVVTNDGDGMTRIGPNLSATGTSRLNLQDRASSYISLYVATTLKARITTGGGNDVGVEVGGTEVSRFHTGGLIVNGTSPVNGAPLTAIRTDLSSSLSVGYFGTGSQGLFIKNDSSDSKYMQFYSSGNSSGGFRFYVGNTLAFQLDTGAGATFYGSGAFASGVMSLKTSQSSANSDPLGDLDGYGGSSYDGYYAVGRPGYSSFVMQFNVGGSVGTVQFAGSYAAAMYRRNKTDNVTWSSWRQVD